MALQTWVARFVVEGGRVTEEGGRLRTFQRRRLDEPDVDLHLLAEPTGVKGEDLGAQALEAIGRAFLQDRLSVTGGLLRALSSTHQTLLEWNRRSIPREQVTLGVTGAIVQGTSVYLAQTGPSLVFLRRDGYISRLEPMTPGGHSPLGEGEVEPLLRRIDLERGDILLAASLSLAEVVDREQLAELLDRGSEVALPELYLLTRDLPAFALFSVSCFEEETKEQPLTEAEPRRLSEPQPLPPPTAPAAGTIYAPQPQPEEDDDLVAEARPVLMAPRPLDISRPVVRLRSDQPAGRSDYARTTAGGRRFSLNIAEPRFAVLGAALVLALFVAAFTVPDLIRENRQEKINRLVTQSALQLDAATNEEDSGTKRTHLEEATRLAGEALRIEPSHAQAAEIHRQATEALGALDAIFDLGPLTTITTLGQQITGDVSIQGVTIAGNLAYLLDTRGGRVIAVPLTPGATPSVVFQQGETYGGTPAKAPQHVAWEGTPQNGRLLVLDAERKLFEVRPGSAPGPVALRRTTTWASVAGIAAYDGNLYVLDPAGNQVHRYLFAANGFDSEPSPTLSGQQHIEDAAAFAVDTEVYVALKSGAVVRFAGGNSAGFELGGIDRAMKSPTSIVVAPSSDEVYIADAGNKRVVVAGIDGAFHRQFVSNDFTDLRALAVDEASAQLYVVVGDALLTAPIVR